MSTAVETARNPIPWWKEPTKDQWYAWVASWLGWTLDAFDFTMFLLIMVPISREFGVPLTEVAFLLSVTLWLRLVGAVGSGWLADRIGRKTPLMISILWYSICNFIAGFSPAFWFLFLFRALLGIGMGAEWPAGAALAMESWPARSRGFMSGMLQGSWSLGFLLASLIYGLAYNAIGWRGLLMIGVLPALSVVYVRFFVKEPPVWEENRRRQRAEKREVHVPLFNIFKPGLLGNTLTACWWMASSFLVYYSINALFATHLQKDLNLSPALVATPILFANLAAFLAQGFWGWFADRFGRRWSMIIPAAVAIFVAPLYLLTTDFTWIAAGFVLARLLRPGDLWPKPRLSVGALPDRGAGDGERLLLPPGRDLRRLRAAGSDLVRQPLRSRFCDPDADRHLRRSGELRDRPAARTGDQGKDPRAGSGRGLTQGNLRRAVRGQCPACLRYSTEASGRNSGLASG